MNRKRSIWRGILAALILGTATVTVAGLWGVLRVEERLEQTYSSSTFAGMRKRRLERIILELQDMGERASWEKQRATSRYLQSYIRQRGFYPEVQTYDFNGRTWENIMVTFPGSNPNDSRILVVAHYDSTNRAGGQEAPGADDNASGVAALLEVAEVLRERTHQNTVQLVFFSNEENGRAGSRAFARKLKEEQTDVRGVLNVDIIGYNDPKAIFSGEVLKVLGMGLPLKLRAKMLAKMSHNRFTHWFNGSSMLKVVAREQDRHLIPGGSEAKREIGENTVRWMIGDICP